MKSIISPTVLPYNILSIFPKVNSLLPLVSWDFSFLFFLLSNVRSIIINHSDVNAHEEKILLKLSLDLSQYYKGKTIIIESLFNSYLIVAPFAKIWQYPIINDKQGEEHFIHRNKITYGSLCGFFPKALQ